MTNPLLSVLLPVHNAAEECERALDSVLAQEFSDFELIIVNDGSDDETPRRLKAVTDSRVRIIEQPHEGLTAALCRGLNESRGLLVARQDADDWSRPDRFARQVAYLNEHRSVAVVGSGVRVVDSSGRSLGEYAYPTEHEPLVRELFRFVNPLPHTTIMFRRREILECGGYRRRFLKSQEYDLFLRVSERYRLGSISEPLCDLQHSMTSLTASDGDGQQFEYCVLGFIAAAIRRDGRADPLDAPDADRFAERYRQWYRESHYPPTFRSRLLRRAARLEWADSRPAEATLALARSLWLDPWWPGERVGVVAPERIAARAIRWARAEATSS